MERFAARKRIIADLTAQGLLEKITDHPLSVGGCYRCKTVVEPYLSLQWYVSVKSLAEPALAAALGDNPRTRIYPDQWRRNYIDWMENIQDWCISRQIWWGHRIPAWYCDDCGKITVTREDPTVCSGCGSSAIRQDPDVLDTWFSSALWPFSTMGWPDKTPELAAFYPTSCLVTGFDILFFWVARMMMMGLHFMEEVPFHEVYIHALVRDAQGQKMSKSKGNVIDPLTVIDSYGTDAFRFTLAAFAAQGRDIKLAEERIAGYRNFANKIWNAARFALMNLEGFDPDPVKYEDLRLSEGEKWILHRLNETVRETNRHWTITVTMRRPWGSISSPGANSATGTWNSPRKSCTAMTGTEEGGPVRTLVRAGATPAPSPSFHAVHYRGDLADAPRQKTGAEHHARPLPHPP